MTLRRLAERISRGVVVKRRLPREFSRLPIYVSPEASLHYWLPLSHADPMLYRMARELISPGDVVWDVGANVGLFSFCAAALGAKSVLAIEPDAWLSQMVARSIVLAGVPVRVMNVAASDRNGVAELEISARSRAANHLTEAQGSGESSTPQFMQAVETVRLDSLLEQFPAPSVLKIDVETHEMKVLIGAENVLATRPTIWCEVAPENSLEVFEFLHQRGYTLYAAANPKPRPPLTRRASWDTLALPIAGGIPPAD